MTRDPFKRPVGLIPIPETPALTVGITIYAGNRFSELI